MAQSLRVSGQPLQGGRSDVSIDQIYAPSEDRGTGPFQGAGAPLMGQPVKAGFPNPAEESGQTPLDLNDLVIKHPASTFYMRVDGDSMVEMGIHTGDLVVIDKSLEIRSGDLVVAYVDGAFTLKTFKYQADRGYLMPANPKYQPIEVTEDTDFQVWGVVTYTVHAHRGRGGGGRA